MAQSTTCSIPGCSRPRFARGWCSTHLSRWYRGLPMDYEKPRSQTLKPCVIDGCDNPRYVRQMCVTHYTRWLRHGDPQTALRPWRTDDPERAKRRGRWRAQQSNLGKPCELNDAYCGGRIVVHHVNEDPTDNRAENLRVLCDRHHRLTHAGDFDLDNPDYSRYYVTRRGTLRRRRAA